MQQAAKVIRTSLKFLGGVQKRSCGKDVFRNVQRSSQDKKKRCSVLILVG